MRHRLAGRAGACALGYTLAQATACTDATAPAHAPPAAGPRPAALHDTLAHLGPATDPGIALQRRMPPAVVAGRTIPRLTVRRHLRWYLADGAGGTVDRLPLVAGSSGAGPFRTDVAATLLVDASEFEDLASVRLSHEVTYACRAADPVLSKTYYMTAYPSPLPEASAGGQSLAPTGPPSAYLFGYVVWASFDAGRLHYREGDWCWVKPEDSYGYGVPGTLRATLIAFTTTYSTKGTPQYPANTAVESRVFFLTPPDPK